SRASRERSCPRTRTCSRLTRVTDTRQRFDALRQADQADVAELEALWAGLATVTVEEVLGAWRGGDFATGHVASRVLQKVRWHGKRFDGPLAAVPLVCRGEDGELYSNTEAAGG